MPAAIGMGKPRKYFPPPALLMAARQLNRARRKAPQITYSEAMNQPTSGWFTNTGFSTMRCTRNAGATPKLTMSASESNSRPKGDS